MSHTQAITDIVGSAADVVATRQASLAKGLAVLQELEQKNMAKPTDDAGQLAYTVMLATMVGNAKRIGLAFEALLTVAFSPDRDLTDEEQHQLISTVCQTNIALLDCLTEELKAVLDTIERSYQ